MKTTLFKTLIMGITVFSLAREGFGQASSCHRSG